MTFAWDGVRGEGIVFHGSVCHNKTLEDGEIRIQVTDVHPINNRHPKYNVRIEAGSFTAMPVQKLYSM